MMGKELVESESRGAPTLSASLGDSEATGALVIHGIPTLTGQGGPDQMRPASPGMPYLFVAP